MRQYKEEILSLGTSPSAYNYELTQQNELIRTKKTQQASQNIYQTTTQS